MVLSSGTGISGTVILAQVVTVRCHNIVMITQTNPESSRVNLIVQKDADEAKDD